MILVKKKKCVMALCKGEVKAKAGKSGVVYTCKKCKAEWFEPTVKDGMEKKNNE